MNYLGKKKPSRSVATRHESQDYFMTSQSHFRVALNKAFYSHGEYKIPNSLSSNFSINLKRQGLVRQGAKTTPKTIRPAEI
jgi:hypothetical protein